MKIKLFKISLFILIIILSITLIINTISSYYLYMDREDIILVLSMFIVGAISGLVIRIGIVLLFWWSYNIKYPNEKYNQKILKKIVASLLFMIIMVGFSLNNGISLIFILCTLLMIVREKNALELNKINSGDTHKYIED